MALVSNLYQRSEAKRRDRTDIGLPPRRSSFCPEKRFVPTVARSICRGIQREARTAARGQRWHWWRPALKLRSLARLSGAMLMASRDHGSQVQGSPILSFRLPDRTISRTYQFVCQSLPGESMYLDSGDFSRGSHLFPKCAHYLKSPIRPQLWARRPLYLLTPSAKGCFDRQITSTNRYWRFPGSVPEKRSRESGTRHHQEQAAGISGPFLNPMRNEKATYPRL